MWWIAVSVEAACPAPEPWVVGVIEEPPADSRTVHTYDLDGDGDLDVVLGANNDKEVSVVENLGGGVLAPEVVLTRTGDGCRFVWADDLDRDGDGDVVASYKFDDTVAWFENVGDWVFTEHILSTQAASSAALHSGDLDGDGLPEVLQASAADSTISYYPNRGYGRFGDEQFLTTELETAYAVQAVDVDGDGDLDVAAGGAKAGTIGWFENQGVQPSEGGAPQVQFGPLQVVATSAVGVRSITGPDLDGDGDADLLVASKQAMTVSWWENLGSGVFGPENILADDKDGARSAQGVDLDGDGDLDVLASALYTEDVFWFENEGADRFGPAITLLDHLGYGVAYQSWAADLNADTHPDVFVGHAVVGWMAGLGGGEFGPEVVIDDRTDGPNPVASADVDGDGDADFVSVHTDDDIVSAYENRGDGTWGIRVTPPFDGNGPRSIATADLDADGDIDWVVASEHDGLVRAVSNEGGWVFEERYRWTLAGARVVRVGDVNGDGRPDIVAIGTFGSLGLVTTAGSGYADPVVLADGIESPADVSLADVDRDDDLDVVVATGVSGVWWAENQAGGTFSALAPLTGGGTPSRSVASSDLDNDGDADLVVVTPTGLVWLENDGSGVFSAHPTAIVLSDPQAVLAVDVDRDGFPDVVVASADGLGWVYNLAMVRTPTWSWIAEGTVRGVSAADVDQDGDIDLQYSSFEDESRTAYNAVAADGDGDGLSDWGETVWGTDCANPDSDGDGRSDGLEMAQGTDPAIAESEGETVSPAKPNACGCAATGGLTPLWVVVALGGMLLRRNRAWMGLALVACHTSTSANPTPDPTPPEEDPPVAAGVCFETGAIDGMATLQLHGAAGDEFGASIAGVGDVNGDGFADIAAGALGSAIGGESAGAAYVVFGGPTLPVDLEDPQVQRVTGSPGDGLGFIIGGPGDVNGDGFADVAIGALGDDTLAVDAGAAYVLFGSAEGVSMARSVRAYGHDADGATGRTVGMGDLDGDGKNDVIVSTEFGVARAGAMSLVLGATLSGTGGSLDLSTQSDMKIVAAGPGAGLNQPGGSADVDGDGLLDLAVAAIEEDNGAGAVYVWYGQQSLPAEIDLGAGEYDVRIAGNPGALAGHAISFPGDVDGDGTADLLVGSPYDSTIGHKQGVVNVVTDFTAADGALLPEVAYTHFDGVVAESRLGFDASGGDLDGDGEVDLAMGAKFESRTRFHSGTLYVVRGPIPAGAHTPDEAGLASHYVTGESEADHLGIVSFAGDLNGDGRSDVVTGSRYWGAAEGALYAMLCGTEAP